MTKTTHSNTAPGYFGKKEKKLAHRLAKRSLEIIASGVGMSATNDFRTLLRDAAKLKTTLSKGTTYQSINSPHMMIINDIFVNVALEMGLTGTNFHDLYDLISEAQNIIHYSLDMVDIREMFNKSESSLAVNSLFNQVRKLSKWIVFDLLAYCWNFGSPRCQKSLAVLMGSAQEYAGSVGGIIEQFGASVTFDMFDTVSRLTSKHNAQKFLKTRFPLIAYRGGYGDNPTDVANGMTWYLDIKTAANTARLSSSTDKQFHLVETLVLDDEIITQLNQTREILIKFDPERQFETVEWNPEYLPIDNKDGAYV